MLRILFPAVRGLKHICNGIPNLKNSKDNYVRFASVLAGYRPMQPIATSQNVPLNFNTFGLLQLAQNITPVRTVTKFSRNKGNRKTVKVVLKKFFRLHWGGWIRTKCGRQKKMFKKSAAQKRRLREHVFCNSTQSYLLDKMVNKFWKRPKYYVDDPYTPYHIREEWLNTRRRPLVRE